MKKAPVTKAASRTKDALKPEYRFDYSKSKPNRFTVPRPAGSVAVLLDTDVAKVFEDAASVNDVLRALMRTMPGLSRPVKRQERDNEPKVG